MSLKDDCGCFLEDDLQGARKYATKVIRNSREVWFYRGQEYRKTNKKVIDGLDEKMLMGSNFASPFRVNSGQDGKLLRGHGE